MSERSSRRAFLRTAATAASGLWIGWASAADGDAGARSASAEGVAATDTALGPFVEIDREGVTTITIPSSELGQGVLTSLAAIVAEELGADWARVRVRPAPLGAAFRNPSNDVQGTGDSRSIRGWYTTLRRLGATGRWLLIEAAARNWQRPHAACSAAGGQVRDDRGRTASYGELAAAAARLTSPRDIELKRSAEFSIIGHRLGRKDTPSKVDGTATFGIDVRLPQLLVAAVAHPPVLGGVFDEFDASAAEAMPGVFAVRRMPFGVAVMASDWWRAQRALARLNLRVRDSATLPADSARDRGRLLHALDSPGVLRWRAGNARAALSSATHRISARYDVPYLAHATLEPMNATAHVTAERCEVWAPTQGPDRVAAACQSLTGLPLERITVHTTFSGGGFGRRSAPDFVIEAVMLSMEAQRPVKVIWSREEDTGHDRYRPMAAIQLDAGLDAAGKLTALHARVAAPRVIDSLMVDFPGLYRPWPSKALDREGVSGISDMPYEIPHLTVDQKIVPVSVPLGYWRSVEYSYTCFFLETFIDEIAGRAGADPAHFRRALLRRSPRLTRVLERATALSRWGELQSPGRFQGLAVLAAYDSFIATVLELSVVQGRPQVHRIICAVDCGTVVDPRTLEAQIESGVIFGLPAALNGEITVQGGRVRQSNFHDYPLLRLPDAPDILVELIRSEAPPGGAGELAVPPVAPALSNAWFAATGTRVRSLPLRSSLT